MALETTANKKIIEKMKIHNKIDRRKVVNELIATSEVRHFSEKVKFGSECKEISTSILEVR